MEGLGSKIIQVCSYSGVSIDEVLDIVVVDDKINSDKLDILLETVKYGAEEVFESVDNFSEWLRMPLLSLGNQSPFDTFSDVFGIEQVQTVLGRIEHGIYS